MISFGIVSSGIVSSGTVNSGIVNSGIVSCVPENRFLIICIFVPRDKPSGELAVISLLLVSNPLLYFLTTC